MVELEGKSKAGEATLIDGDRVQQETRQLAQRLANQQPVASSRVSECNSLFTKVVVGIQVLLTRSLFGDGILRRSLPRVSRAKPTSAHLLF